MANKPVKFETKIIYNSKIYLRVSDVAKVFNQKISEFKELHSNMIAKIPSCGECISETDFNQLLADDLIFMKKQEQLEITKIESLRAKTDAVINFQPLKILLGRNMLKQLADMKGCKTIEEYITKYEVPGEMNKALEELLQNRDRNIDYSKMVDYLFHQTKDFDIERIRSYGLDVQVLTSVQIDGKVTLDAFVVGKGVFYRVTDFGDYELWNELYIDDNGELILPYCNYDSRNPEERNINISTSGIDRDFREHGVIENMLWCIENLEVTGIEDLEYSVIGCNLETVLFEVPIELLIKMVRPDAVSTIYIDKIIDLEHEEYLTDVKDMKVFAE